MQHVGHALSLVTSTIEPKWAVAAAAASSAVYALRSYYAGGVFREKVDLTGKVIFITGATSGIGIPTAIELAKMGSPRVIIAARDLKKAENVVEQIKSKSGNSNIQIVRLDLSDLDSVNQCVKDLSTLSPEPVTGIDILVLNAGLITQARETTKQGFEAMVGSMHLGHALLTHCLLPIMTNGSRIIVVSSRAHEFGKLDFIDMHSERAPFDSFTIYSRAKLCNLHFVRALAKRLTAQGRDITVNAVHPGFISSGLYRESGIGIAAVVNVAGAVFGKNALQGAQTTIYAAAARELEGKTGNYLADCQIAQNLVAKHVTEENDDKLWEWTLQSLKISQFGKPL